MADVSCGDRTTQVNSGDSDLQIRERDHGWSPGSIPRRWIQWLAARLDGGLYVFGEIGIGNWSIPQPILIGPSQSNAFINRTAWPWGCLDHGHRSMIPLDDNLEALLELFQHGMEIPSDFGFRHVD